ncbi:MAG: protein tyrosine phosphatase [Clostridiales bacterium]|jgi:protein-tyrosine-phosphatase|uniref:arsenate reductase/protein-tyrosine-phosphatase family protein n=1 Tax=Bovifimicola ammoniilytica TaxID=2981720 RepID=UPI000337CCA6|nr:low molecular weight phosphotyrosine protein phosphatase [Bovifimicola ammoniilytica]MBD8942320.1 protein tyrosine phosphatase [Clostridiales bacterium]MCU6754109.1 protein tyrosine phosphatase [Bovifimicola ammoniilytica]CCZ03698.1 low molecular weight phosphotyrosine protein phosphatase [Eubacterium sp. CAG:603]SCJ80384.1 Low molecular weight protein-tyrosine-phosphatase ptpB [uncultured Eubacterium sp.]
MNRYQKVIFVSTGGTCRSILAKAIYRNINTNEDLQIESRGLVVLFEEPVNPKAVAIAKSKGISIEDEKSEQLTMDDFGDDILVLVMTDLLKKKVYDEFENAVNVYSIREFAGEAIDVEAAYGGELTEYGSQFKYLEKLITIVKDKIEQDE